MATLSPWYDILPVGALVLIAVMAIRAWALHKNLIGAPTKAKRWRLPKSRLRWN